MFDPTVNIATDPVDGEILIEVNQGPFGISLTVEQATRIARELSELLFDLHMEKYREARKPKVPVLYLVK